MKFTDAIVFSLLAACQTLAAPSPLEPRQSKQVFAKPNCGKDEKAYCVRGEFDFTVYNANNARCENNGYNKVFCSRDSDLKANILKNLPNGYTDSRGNTPNPNSSSQNPWPQNGNPQNGYPQNGYPQNGNPQNGYPQNGNPQNGNPQNGFPPQNGGPQNGFPPNGPNVGRYNNNNNNNRGRN